MHCSGGRLLVTDLTYSLMWQVGATWSRPGSGVEVQAAWSCSDPIWKATTVTAPAHSGLTPFWCPLSWLPDLFSDWPHLPGRLWPSTVTSVCFVCSGRCILVLKLATTISVMVMEAGLHLCHVLWAVNGTVFSTVPIHFLLSDLTSMAVLIDPDCWYILGAVPVVPLLLTVVLLTAYHSDDPMVFYDCKLQQWHSVAIILALQKTAGLSLSEK